MRFRSLLCGAAAVAALAGCASNSATTGGNRVSIQVTEKGFEPEIVTVQAGQPVTLLVKRTTDATCATELVMKEENINQKLPLNEEVAITFTPKKAGDLVYACGMDMYKGTVRVQ
jgi:plastocyanin domain-containing protein